MTGQEYLALYTKKTMNFTRENRRYNGHQEIIAMDVGFAI